MQEDPKSSGCPTKPGVPEERPVLWGKASAQPIFESRAVYILNVLQKDLKIYTIEDAEIAGAVITSLTCLASPKFLSLVTF